MVAAPLLNTSYPLKNPNENGCIDLWEKWWETEGKKQYGEPAQ